MIRILFLFSVLLQTIYSHAHTWQICSSCSTKTIAEGVTKAAPGDTLLIKGGIYQCENVEITKSLTLIGETGAILDGNKRGYVLKILTENVTISGLKIINSGRSYTKDFAAIYLFKANNFKIINNSIVNPFFGILVEKSKDGLIKGNTIDGIKAGMSDSGNGIHLWHCQRVKISNNTIYQMRDGIYLEFVDESRIEKNYAHNNVRYGLHFMFSNHDEYLSNTFEHNGAGVAVMFSKFIIMKGNRFIENWGTASYGLLLKEIYDAEVTENLFSENTIGIYNEGSTRVNYSKNIFNSNGWAVKISGGCYANRFFNNNFNGNSFDVSYNAKMNDNSFEGNYWSDYSGYDLDKNGIGDVPYRPVKLFSYIVNQTPETIILLRSLFVDIINFSEKVSPVFTPDDLVDNSPLMKAYK